MMGGWETEKEKSKKRGDLSFINDIEELKGLPLMVMGAIMKLNEPKFKRKEFMDIIVKDKAITSFILKFFNSPYWGLPHSVKRSNLRHAFDWIPHKEVKRGIMPYLLRSLYNKIANKKFAKSLWRHSFSVAVIARELAIQFKEEPVAEDAYIAGLLHDIGKLVIIFHEEEDYFSVLGVANLVDNEPLDEENDVYGYTHAKAGRYLLNHWKLPPRFVESAFCHHRFNGDELTNSECDEEVVRLVALANQICHHKYDKQKKPSTGLLIHFGLYDKAANEDKRYTKYDELWERIEPELEKSLKEFSGLI